MRNKSALKLLLSDQDIVRCFDSAIHNAVKINTVRCNYRRYNKTGLLKHPYMIRAGRNYKTPWTRDASINTWQAMNFIDPEVSRTTLLAVCDTDANFQPVIQPDVQTWDQIVWAIGAYNYYLTTGDEEFLTIAYGVICRALSTHRKNRFNEKYGLFVGGSFFNDGIAGYPLSCHQDGNNDSFAPAHPVVETIMCLSTNCLYCEASAFSVRFPVILDWQTKPKLPIYTTMRSKLQSTHYSGAKSLTVTDIYFIPTAQQTTLRSSAATLLLCYSASAPKKDAT